MIYEHCHLIADNPSVEALHRNASSPSTLPAITCMINLSNILLIHLTYQLCEIPRQKLVYETLVDRTSLARRKFRVHLSARILAVINVFSSLKTSARWSKMKSFLLNFEKTISLEKRRGTARISPFIWIACWQRLTNARPSCWFFLVEKKRFVDAREIAICARNEQLFFFRRVVIRVYSLCQGII